MKLRLVRVALLVGTGALGAATVQAQTDSTHSTAPPVARASWLTTRASLRVGDAVTVIVDERTHAIERVSRFAVGDRSTRSGLNLGMDTGSGAGTQILGAFNTNSDNRSNDVGEAGRLGDLTGTITARVIEMTPEGLARLRGSRRVTVDGRAQELTLEGLVRPEDVSGTNQVSSSRIAEAVIDFKGKGIGPRRGFFGKLIGMLWP